METRTYHRVNKNGGTVKFLYSACDEELVKAHKWQINAYGYVYAKIKAKTKYFTRLIVDGEYIDHIDGNPLNNTRENLRPCTHSENLMNRGKNKNNTSGYKGVSFDKRDGYWQAKIDANGKKLSLGRSKCKHLAALKYNEAAIKYHGKFVKLNEVKDEDLL